MRKIKLFRSIYKEREWLEEMAGQGWLFAGVTMGVLYYFEQTEPCEKLFEIERFDISTHTTMEELDARNLALDLASRSGWSVIFQDADMNYYFMKDKKNSECNELYSDAKYRRERAERFRKHHAINTPISLLVEWLIISIFCMLILFMMLPILQEIDPAVPVIFGLIYIITTITEIGSAFYNITLGQYLYDELLLSREAWEAGQQFRFKKHFRTVGQLKEFLFRQSEEGLVLSNCSNNHYLFEQDANCYDYFVDTKSCFKKRMSEQPASSDSDALHWYEFSIAYASEYHLKPLGIIRNNAIVYRRPHSAAPLPAENDSHTIHSRIPSLLKAALVAGALLVGLFIGIFVVRMGL